MKSDEEEAKRKFVERRSNNRENISSLMKGKGGGKYWILEKCLVEINVKLYFQSS